MIWTLCQRSWNKTDKMTHQTSESTSLSYRVPPPTVSGRPVPACVVLWHSLSAAGCCWIIEEFYPQMIFTHCDESSGVIRSHLQWKYQTEREQEMLALLETRQLRGKLTNQSMLFSPWDQSPTMPATTRFRTGKPSLRSQWVISWPESWHRLIWVEREKMSGFHQP